MASPLCSCGPRLLGDHRDVATSLSSLPRIGLLFLCSHRPSLRLGWGLCHLRARATSHRAPSRVCPWRSEHRVVLCSSLRSMWAPAALGASDFTETVGVGGRGCVCLPRLPVCPPPLPLPSSESVPVLTPFSSPSLNQTPSPAFLGRTPSPCTITVHFPSGKSHVAPTSLPCAVASMSHSCCSCSICVFKKKCLSSAFSHQFVTLKYIILVLANLTSVVVRRVVYFI